ncbi:hypothetical protein FRC05_004541 [Tulasnella sp. 425]|nr:hypothetical protein FRC05_004541 [Tulasnella sp. 425]
MPDAGSLGALKLEVEVAVPSANHSRMIAQADIDKIENANRRGRSSDRKRGGATIARRGPALLDTIAEDSASRSRLPPSVLRPPPTPRFNHRLMRTNENPHDSGVALSAQVSGTAPETGFVAKLGSRRLEVEAAVASARQSPMVMIQANLENGNKRGNNSSGRRKGATLARREASRLDSIAEDLEDSTTSSNIALTASSSSTSIPTPVATDTAVEPPTNAHDHPLREAPAAEDTVENKPKRVVSFSDEVQVRDLPMSKWDWEARSKFHSEAKEREIEDEYRVWGQGEAGDEEEARWGAVLTDRVVQVEMAIIRR